MLDNYLLKSFVDLSLEEKKMVLSWRNNPNIKKWMYTNDDITLDNHLKFIDSLKENDLKKYFLVMNNEQYIGVIDFTDISEKSLKMGLYSNPDLKGMGRILLEIIVEYSFNVLNTDKIIAEVFSNNTQAYALYEAFKFKKVIQKDLNNKRVICMELLRNRNKKGSLCVK